MWVCPWPMSMTTALSDDFDRSRVPDHSGPLWPPPSPWSPRPCPFQYPTFHRPRPWQGRGPRHKPETCVQEIANLRWSKVTLHWLHLSDFPHFPFTCVSLAPTLTKKWAQSSSLGRHAVLPGRRTDGRTSPLYAREGHHKSDSSVPRLFPGYQSTFHQGSGGTFWWQAL